MNLALEDDLTFETGEIRIIAYEIIEFIGVVAMRDLIVRYCRGQILGFVYRHIDVRVGMRVAIDENMTFHRQLDALAQGSFLFVPASENSRPGFDYIFFNAHQCTPNYCSPITFF